MGSFVIRRIGRCQVGRPAKVRPLGSWCEFMDTVLAAIMLHVCTSESFHPMLCLPGCLYRQCKVLNMNQLGQDPQVICLTCNIRIDMTSILCYHVDDGARILHNVHGPDRTDHHVSFC